MPRLRKPCSRCEEYFVPNTRYTKLCDKCFSKARVRGAKRGGVSNYHGSSIRKIMSEVRNGS